MFEQLIKRLRKHPVITMDKQNVTGDAADWMQELKDEIMEMPCYGDWCGKSPDMKGNDGMCEACTIKKRFA